jgi:hypothetical protein
MALYNTDRLLVKEICFKKKGGSFAGMSYLSGAGYLCP